MKLLEAKNLFKSFGHINAVSDISISLNVGEVIGFLGPNGAGKSTTMKMLTGFLETDSGSIEIKKLDLSKDPINTKSIIGYLPEGAPSYSDMTVKSFLYFVGRMRGLKDEILEKRLEIMLNDINLTEVQNQIIETLSKGYKRRVGIAQALIHDPDILILDEPTDGLDPNQKFEMRKLIKSISKNKGIIISTHILEEVEAVCSRTIIIANGKILLNKKTAELLKNKKTKLDDVFREITTKKALVKWKTI